MKKAILRQTHGKAMAGMADFTTMRAFKKLTRRDVSQPVDFDGSTKILMVLESDRWDGSRKDF